MSCTLAATYGRIRAVRERFAVACEDGIVGDRRPARRRHGAWIFAWWGVIRRAALLPALAKVGLTAVALATLSILLESASARRPSPRAEADHTVTQPVVARPDVRATGGTAEHVDAAGSQPTRIAPTPADMIATAVHGDFGETDQQLELLVVAVDPA